MARPFSEQAAFVHELLDAFCIIIHQVDSPCVAYAAMDQVIHFTVRVFDIA
jgi:hypothetical protein